LQAFLASASDKSRAHSPVNPDRILRRDVEQPLRGVDLAPRRIGIGRVILKTRVRNLLQQKKLFGEGHALHTVKNGVDIRDRVRGQGRRWRVRAVAVHQKHAGSATGHLHRHRSVPVSVMPERPGGMVGRDVDLVGELGFWPDVQQDVVAVTRRRDVHAVRVEINRIEAGDAGRLIEIETRRRIRQAARIVRTELVLQIDPERAKTTGRSFR
jgi:hypothetical protein